MRKKRWRRRVRGGGRRGLDSGWGVIGCVERGGDRVGGGERKGEV